MQVTLSLGYFSHKVSVNSWKMNTLLKFNTEGCSRVFQHLDRPCKYVNSFSVPTSSDRNRSNGGDTIHGYLQEL